MGRGGNQTAFLVESNSVTIEHLTIDGRTNSSSDNFANGIVTNNDGTGYQVVALTPYSDLTAEYLTVENVSNTGIGVLTQGTGNQILHNTLTDVGYNSIFVFGATATIADNVITGTGVDENPATASDGIVSNELTRPDGSEIAPVLTIQGNTISQSNAGMNLAALGAGSLIGETTAGVDTLDANHVDVTGTTGGDSGVGILVSWANGPVAVTGNQITANNDANGIALFYDGTNTISLTGNSVTVPSGDLSVDDSATGGGNGAGIFISDDYTYFGEGEAGGSTAAITGNTISGFVTGIEVQSMYDTAVSATIGDGTTDGVNTISNSNWGVLVEGSGASAAINDNSIQSFQDYGVQLAYDAYGSVTGNTIVASDGAYAGISVYDFTQAGSTLTIKKTM